MFSPPSQPPTAQPPLWAPYYGASFPTAFLRIWRKYAVFTGRASRSEYWWWGLANTLTWFALTVGGLAAGTPGETINSDGTSEPGPGFIPFGIIILAWMVATIVPNFAVLVRRLHDADLSGWLALLAFVPFLGGLAIVVFTLLPTQPTGQRYDRPPRSTVSLCGFHH
jgi:uncharacterized membrane protein YhaH (DUF805 family)